MHCNFPNGNCAWCHYGHTISTRSEAIQEFITFHTHPLAPTFTSRVIAGQCQHRLAGSVCLTGSCRDLAWWRSHHLLGTPPRKYNLTATVKKRMLEGLWPGKKCYSLAVTHSPSSPESLIGRTTHMDRTAAKALKNATLQVLGKGELDTSELW